MQTLASSLDVSAGEYEFDASVDFVKLTKPKYISRIIEHIREAMFKYRFGISSNKFS